jgi:DNA repair protein RecO
VSTSRTEAVLIGRHPLTETSLIIHWCSAGHGLMKTVAKGALRPKSAFAGKLDLFVSAEISFAASRRSDLHVLREAAVTAHRPGLRQGYLKVLAASYFVKLIEGVAERETGIPELHALLTRALDYLESHQPDLRAVSHFESELARALGLPFARDAAIRALESVCHRLPVQRPKLIEAIKSAPPDATGRPPTGSSR